MGNETAKQHVATGWGGTGAMSANQYAALIKTAEVRNADRTWFPRWVFKYASSL